MSSHLLKETVKERFPLAQERCLSSGSVCPSAGISASRELPENPRAVVFSQWPETIRARLGVSSACLAQTAQLLLAVRARTASLRDTFLKSILCSPDTRLSLDVSGMTYQTEWYGGDGSANKVQISQISWSPAAPPLSITYRRPAQTPSPLLASSPVQYVPHGGAPPEQSGYDATCVCLHHSVSCPSLVTLGFLHTLHLETDPCLHPHTGSHRAPLQLDFVTYIKNGDIGASHSAWH